MVVSTTLVPPSFYAVRSHGRPLHLYRSVGDAAAAVVELAPTAATVYVVIGGQGRSLSDRELGELGRCIRARRLASERRWRELTAAEGARRSHPQDAAAVGLRLPHAW
jgi:hypothetical protein